MKIKKSIVLIAAVVAVSIFAYYRYAVKILQANKNEDVTPVAVEPKKVVAVEPKKVSAVTKYMAAPGKEDELRFTLTLDKDGVITDVITLDAKTNEVPEKKKAFNEGLSVVIKGKKLSELSAVDKIGTSTLTTNAFNSVINQLKAQI